MDGPVGKAFAAYPPGIRRKLMRIRKLILDTAARTKGLGGIEETVKWGEPAYLPMKPKTGTTVRIGWKKSKPAQYAVYFHCQTTLVDTFRTLFPQDFRYEGNRAIVFAEQDAVPENELSFCIAAALTYHAARRRTGAAWRGQYGGTLKKGHAP